ncbi:MAG: ABC transporter permease [Candidatus Dormibacteria bacterium]
MTINTTILKDPSRSAATPSRTSRALRLPRSPKVITGLVILAVFAVIAIIGAWIAPYSPNLTNESWVQHVLVAGTGPGTNIKADYYPLPLPPSSAHWLGTTIFAQDVWSQLLVSTQATVAVGLLAAAIATVLSIIVGVTAGYLGGGADEGLSLLGNVFLAIPGLPLLIVLADYVPAAGTSIFLVSLIIAITAWAYSSRVLRAQTLSLRNRDFVEAPRHSCSRRCTRSARMSPSRSSVSPDHRHRHRRASGTGATCCARCSRTMLCAAAGGGGGCHPAFASRCSEPAWRSSTSASTNSSIRGSGSLGSPARLLASWASAAGRSLG